MSPVARVALIIHQVCSFYERPVDTVLSKSRKGEVVRARFVAMALSRRYTRLSLAEIGRTFNRTHNDVLYAVRSVEDHISIDPEYADEVLSLCRIIEQEITNEQKQT